MRMIGRVFYSFYRTEVRAITYGQTSDKPRLSGQLTKSDGKKIVSKITVNEPAISRNSVCKNSVKVLGLFHSLLNSRVSVITGSIRLLAF